MKLEARVLVLGFWRPCFFCSFKKYLLNAYVLDPCPTSAWSVSFCLPGSNCPHFPLGNGDQLTSPPTPMQSCNSGQPNKHIPFQWPQWLLQGHDGMMQNMGVSPRALRELLVRRCFFFPLELSILACMPEALGRTCPESPYKKSQTRGKQGPEGKTGQEGVGTNSGGKVCSTSHKYM